MTGLRPPPTSDAPSHVVVRMLVLLLLLLVVGVVVWSVVTNQRIRLTETTPHEDVELAGPALIDGMTINVVHDGLGSQPVILLHDFDVAGGVLWDAVVAELGGDVTAVRIDLPGLGLSSRLPAEGPEHTVASMAATVREIVAQRFADQPVLFVGVGLGGEVAAEIAVTDPDVVLGLVLIDVDFDRSAGWIETVERLPIVGVAATFTLEGGGSQSSSIWAPNCTEGGWCPTPAQSEARDRAAQIRDTTDSLRAFRRTQPSSFVPSNLDEVIAPTVYIWSTEGVVPREGVDLVTDAIPGVEVIEVDVWKAHLESADVVAAAVLSFPEGS